MFWFLKVHSLTHVIWQLNNILPLCLLAVRAPGGLVVSSTTGNLTVCWTSPPDDPPDGYYITSHPLIYPTPTSLWINQSSPGAHWVNESVCVNLGSSTPGQTYKVGVVSLRGKDRSKRTSITHTTGKRNKGTAFKEQVCNFTWKQSAAHLNTEAVFVHTSHKKFSTCWGTKIQSPHFVHKCI